MPKHDTCPGGGDRQRKDRRPCSVAPSVPMSSVQVPPEGLLCRYAHAIIKFQFPFSLPKKIVQLISYNSSLDVNDLFGRFPRTWLGGGHRVDYKHLHIHTFPSHTGKGNCFETAVRSHFGGGDGGGHADLGALRSTCACTAATTHTSSAR
jgi:hypothetical protein